jgi:hypothetical protein
MHVSVTIDYITLTNSNGYDIDSISVTCSRCGTTIEIYGTSSDSVKRGCAELREQCDETNFYTYDGDDNDDNCSADTSSIIGKEWWRHLGTEEASHNRYESWLREGERRQVLAWAGTNVERLKLVQVARDYDPCWVWHASHTAAEHRVKRHPTVTLPANVAAIARAFMKKETPTSGK